MRSLRARHRGQSLVLIAVMMMAIFGTAGLAIDGAVALFWSTAAEKAAAAAALAGVEYMPNSFESPVRAGTRNDAADRARDEARRNGFVNGESPDVVVDPEPAQDPRAATRCVAVGPPGARAPGPGCHPHRLKVTVRRLAPVAFMGLFGFQPFPVSRTAVAEYLPPLGLGSPRNQVGATLGQLGTAQGQVPFYARLETKRYEEGDPFSPSQALGGEVDHPFPPGDVHQLSGPAARDTETTVPRGDPAFLGIDQINSSAPKGGYNFRVTLPAPGRIQIYNASHSPETGTQNRCDNFNPALRPPDRGCSTMANGTYHEWGHLQESCDQATNTPTSRLSVRTRYTLFKVNDDLVRDDDQLLMSLVFDAIDATDFANGNFRDIDTGQTYRQTFTPDGHAENNRFYHDWVDYTPATSPGDPSVLSILPRIQPLGNTLQPDEVFSQFLRSLASGTPPSTEPVFKAGTYRVRVDPVPKAGETAACGFKAFSLRALGADGSDCSNAGCTVSGWNDLCMDIVLPPDSTFSTQLVRIPAEYAGLTVGVDIYDPGDLAVGSANNPGSAEVTLEILDPSDAPARAPRSSTHGALLLGAPAPLSPPPAAGAARFVATSNGRLHYNGKWVHLSIAVPSIYAPPPGKDFWSLKYTTGSSPLNAVHDTITVSVGLIGRPVHLVRD